MHHGDYSGQDCVGQVWLVEHKLVDTLLQDMLSGQLQKQCQGIIDHSTFPILMIEGQVFKRKENGQEYLCSSWVTWKRFWSQLRSIQDAGCRLEFTTSLDDTVERLITISEYYSEGKHDSMRRHLSGDRFIEVLSMVEGIDMAKATALKGISGNLGLISVLSKNWQDLTEASGIGQVLAKRIQKFFWEG